MKKNAFLFASAMLLLPSACCAVLPAKQTQTLMSNLPKNLAATSAARCNGSQGPCTHSVVVTSTSGGCTVAAVPDIMVIVATGTPAQVEWRIRTPGFKFAKADGIRFKEQSDFEGKPVQILIPAKDQFRDLKRVDDHTYTVTDINTKVGAWLYDIQVTSDDGKQTCKLDPPIVNDI